MNYSSILKGIQNYMKTNFTGSEIRDLIKLQVRDMPNWTIEKQNLTGTGSAAVCYSTGMDTTPSIIIPDQSSINKAVEKIKQVAGE